MASSHTLKRSRSRTAHIRFAPDILRRLGEELNPSLDQGIIELVKNAYDADARNCTVELSNTDEPGGSIHVWDDGDGMDLDAIVKGWLVCGSSTKSVKKRTRLGRVPAGNKGLGRLAALRMGGRALLTTRPRTGNSELGLPIEWSAYDDAKLVDDVPLKIREVTRPSDKGKGTDIRIESLRRRVGRMDVKRLARAMILLADPFDDDPSSFNPVLIAPEFSDLEELVQRRYFNDAEYHLRARVDKRGRGRASVVDWKGKKLFEATHGELMKDRSEKPYECPAATFDLWVYLLQKSTFELRKVTLGEVREWLQAFGGVHLYENGLRVSPYGNPGNDWLDMNRRRAQNPEERPSTNTLVGRVNVDDSSELLIQKTDRSGFIESEGFVELRQFAQDSMEWMARRRLDEAEKRRAKERKAAAKRTSRSKRALDKAISEAPKKNREELAAAAAAYDKSRQREVNRLKQEVQLYRTLSTAGITAATFAHESSGSAIKTITLSIKTIERRGQQALGEAAYEKKLKRSVDRIVKSLESLGVLGAATLKLIDHEKRRQTKVAVHDVIDEVVATFRPFLDERKVKVLTDFCGGGPYLRATEAAIESVVTNLINNSVTAFEASKVADRRILVRTTIAQDILSVHVLDNAEGIIDIALRDIWLPGQTTRQGGTGLGLTIVRDTVSDLGGQVDAVAQSELGGAEIIVELPIIGT